MSSLNFGTISSHYYSANADDTLVLQSLKEVSIGLMHEFFFGYNALNSVQSAMGADSDGQVGNLVLFQEILTLIFTHYLNKEVSGGHFLSVIIFPNNVFDGLSNQEN